MRERDSTNYSRCACASTEIKYKKNHDMSHPQITDFLRTALMSPAWMTLQTKNF